MRDHMNKKKEPKVLKKNNFFKYFLQPLNNTDSEKIQVSPQRKTHHRREAGKEQARRLACHGKPSPSPTTKLG